MEELIKILVPKEYQYEFFKLKEMFENEDYELLYDEYEELFDELFNDKKEFMDELGKEELSLENILIWRMIDYDIILQIDYSGEDYNFEIEEFLNNRLEQRYSERFQVSTKEIYRELENKSEFDSEKRFEFIITNLNKQLMKNDYKITIFDLDDDQYYLTLVSGEEYDKLKSLKLKFIRIIEK